MILEVLEPNVEYSLPEIFSKAIDNKPVWSPPFKASLFREFHDEFVSLLDSGKLVRTVSFRYKLKSTDDPDEIFIELSYEAPKKVFTSKSYLDWAMQDW